MKFDYMISNPPYNNNLDLKIIKEVYPLVADDGKMCFIHPAGWLYDKRYKSKIYNSTKELLQNDFYGYEILPTKNVNTLFNIAQRTDMVISAFNIGNGMLNIHDIHIQGDNDVFKSSYNKIMKYCSRNETLDSKLQKNNNDTYEVAFNCVATRLSDLDYYVIYRKSNKDKFNGHHTTYYAKYGFSIFEDAKRFVDYLSLKITRFCLSLTLINQHLDSGLSSVPYLPTYTHEWTDEMVAKELGLTDEELRWAINWIPDYYPEDAERYAKYFDPEQKERYLINEKVTYGGHKPL